MENQQVDYNKSKFLNQQVKFFNPKKLFYGAFIPNAILKYPNLSPSAKLLYARLVQFSGENDFCFPSYSTLSEELSLSKRQIIRLVKELAKEGFIYIERTSKKANKFYFLWHPCFQDAICKKSNLMSPLESKKLRKNGTKTEKGGDINMKRMVTSMSPPSDMHVTLINSYNKLNKINKYKKNNNNMMSPPYSTVTPVTNVLSKAFRCKKCKNLALKERESKKFAGVCLDCEREYEKSLENQEIFRCLECKKLFKKEEILLAEKNQGICFKCYFGEKNSSLRRLKAIKTNIVKPIVSDEERTKLDEKIAKEERKLKRKNK